MDDRHEEGVRLGLYTQFQPGVWYRDLKQQQEMDVIYKISLYADDVLLFLQNADTSLPSTLQIIIFFASVSEKQEQVQLSSHRLCL